MLGLAAMVLLVVRVARMTGALRLGSHNLIRLGLGLAWLNAFAYQGLTGSYEDARHLWVLVGLILAADRIGAIDGSRQRSPAANSLANRGPAENER